MKPEELIAWHAHQITFLPETGNALVQHHRDAMHCIEKLRAERDALVQQIGEVNDDLGIIDHCQIKPLFDALRKDAERYRGLREMPQFFGWDADYRPDEIDTQVDAALAAKEGP